MSELTQDYYTLISNEELAMEYKNCLREFVHDTIVGNPVNLETMVLYGGLVRDRAVLNGWSDIDIILVFNDIRKRRSADLATITERLERRYTIRIDLTQISLNEIVNEKLAAACLNGEIVNALSMREGVAVVLFGSLPKVAFSRAQEEQAALFYVTNTLGLLRRYMVEVIYRGEVDEHIRRDLGRVIRWTFSILRASLRLFGVFTHPYEHCIGHLMQVFPNLDTSLLTKLMYIRRNFESVQIPEALDVVDRTERFVEDYVMLCLRTYYDQVPRNR